MNRSLHAIKISDAKDYVATFLKNYEGMLKVRKVVDDTLIKFEGKVINRKIKDTLFAELKHHLPQTCINNFWVILEKDSNWFQNPETRWTLKIVYDELIGKDFSFRTTIRTTDDRFHMEDFKKENVWMYGLEYEYAKFKTIVTSKLFWKNLDKLNKSICETEEMFNGIGGDITGIGYRMRCLAEN